MNYFHFNGEFLLCPSHVSTKYEMMTLVKCKISFSEHIGFSISVVIDC
jgi:hypothetical protein